jgi:hypothetical protein
MKTFSLIIISLLLFVICFSQTNVTIKVIDKISNEPLIGASVIIKHEQRQLITDATGFVSIASSKEIVISFIGYKTVETVANNNQTIALQPVPINLTDVTVNNHAIKGNINTLAKIDLDLRPVKSSQDLMRIVPGLFIAQHQGGGKAEQLFLRGFDADHGTDIQISVDGMPVNMVSHAHGQGYADLHFLIPETVNTIDYGKGPYNADHGNLATAGYANFSTLNRLPQNEIKVEAGSFNTVRNVMLLNLTPQKNQKTNAYVATEFLYTDGPFINKEAFKRYSGFFKLNSQLNTNNLLQLQASAMSSNWSASGQIPERAIEQGIVDRFGSIDPAEGGVTNRYSINAKLITSLHNNSTLENQLYFVNYNFNLLSNFTFFANDSINGDRITQYENRNVFGYNNKFTNTSYFNNGNSVFSAGLGMRIDDIKNIGLSHVLDRETELSKTQYGNILEANVSAYVDEKIELNKWLIDVGIRADYFHFHYTDKLGPTQNGNNDKATISPKLNIYYTVNNRTQLYFKTGKGFHSNDTRVVLAGTSKEILPVCYGSDVGIIFKPSPNLLINVAVWYLYFQSELVYGGDEGVIEASGRTQRMGIDFSGRYQFNKWLNIFTDINIANARTIDGVKGQNHLPLAPTFTSTGGTSVKLKNGWNGSLCYRYIADRPANTDNSIIAKGYFVTDANINYTRKKFEAGLIIENLLNVKWNEAQFATLSRLKNEPAPVDDLNFTPGTPFAIRAKISFFF